ncbi:atrial natriuretic peptide receptor 3-like [Gigantopelta aegis]|uniref:atrial natriuretic peptide receptor 3-like n=1 Tax=Gigantopelta aegis TaxID=1735272 RepID=UPI001B88A163|nr:atrial natriuretic peptide receptor 3-like [Gigantopelta aegis]
MIWRSRREAANVTGVTLPFLPLLTINTKQLKPESSLRDVGRPRMAKHFMIPSGFVGLLFFNLYIICVKGDTDHISIAALQPVGNKMLFSMSRVSPAIAIAIEKVTAPNGVLHNRKIIVRYRDSKCSPAVAMNEMINFYIEDQFHVVLGPCCDYPAAPIARQMKFWNLPMITVGAMAVDFVDKTTEYPMVTRTGPTINFLAEYLIEILKTFRWNRINLLYDPMRHGHVEESFCHIVAEGIHYVLTVQKKMENFALEYFQFKNDSEILDNIELRLGTEYAGE